MAEQIAGLLPLILIIAVGYLLIIRPARKRQRDLLSVQQQLSPGVQVMTTSGMYGTVRQVIEDRIVLETSPGVRTTWSRNAIARVVKEPLDLTDTAPSARPGAPDHAPTDVTTPTADGSVEPGAGARRTETPGS